MDRAIESAVLKIVQTHTHYGASDLQPDRHLEGELGIDSVVLATILNSVRQEFQLTPEKLKIAPVTLRELVDGVAAALQQGDANGAARSNGSNGTHAANGTNGKPAASAAPAGDVDAVRRKVIAAVVRHTDYPEAKLSLDAHLEAELGIDSVVLASILTDLVRELGLEPGSLKGNHQTLRDVLERVASKVGAKAPAAPSPAVVAAAVRPSAPQVHASAPASNGSTSMSNGSTPKRPEPVAAPVMKAAPMTNGSAEKLAAPMAPPPMRTAIAGGVDNLLLPEFSQLAQQVIGDAPAKDATFAAQGLSLEKIQALRQAVVERFDVKPALRLEDCDTLEKLQRFVLASRAELPPEPPGKRTPGAAPSIDWDGKTMKDFVEERDRDLFKKVRSFNDFYRKRQKEHLYWYGMPLESPCKNRAVIYDEIAGKHREFLMFASNNYLGVANHPKVIEAIADAYRRYGATNTGCRLIGGTNVLHKELERRLAKFKHREACIIYPSGYSANLGAISALVKNNDAVIVDKFNHMSIVDGCKLSGGIRRIYQHNDMEDLEKVLQRTSEQADGMLIVADGVFSMHGNIVKLPEMVRLAKKYGAKTLIDDAHSTGVLGKTGSGTAEHFGLKGEVDLELGTMSKALGGLGGFVCADGEVVEYLRFYSNSYVFAANIPAGVAAGLIASIDLIEKEPERLTQLWTNINYFRGKLLEIGFNLGESESAIVPIVIGDDRKTLELGRAVRARGLFCQTVVFPGVSVGDARMRISMSSDHTREDLDLAVEIFIDAATEVGVLPKRPEAAR